MVTLYSYDDMKKYNQLDPIFSHLPQEVKSVLVHKFENLTQENYHTLRKHGSFKLPNNEPLFEMDENTSNMLPNSDNINPTLPTPANTPQHSPPNNTISAPINEEKTKKHYNKLTIEESQDQ